MIDLYSSNVYDYIARVVNNTYSKNTLTAYLGYRYKMINNYEIKYYDI